MKNLLFLLVIFAILLSACGLVPNSNVAQSEVEREVNPIVPREDAQVLVEGNNAFAFDLYQSLNEEDGNIIFSPYSISLALAMTYAGARGETEVQMAKVLHFDLPQDKLHPAFNNLNGELEKIDSILEEEKVLTSLNIANSLWVQKNYRYEKDFLDMLARNYGSGLRLADFNKENEIVRLEINALIEEQTNGIFKNYLGKDAIKPNTRMVLANAIYLKAAWSESFPEEKTSNQSFHLLDGSTIEVPMMHQASVFDYAAGNTYQAVDLRFKNDMSMLIIVPKEGQFDKVDKYLDRSLFEDILSKLDFTDVTLALPKFSSESGFHLEQNLSNMGMPDAFDSSLANFSGMTGSQDLVVDKILHKAFIAVNEKNAEAAAVTVVFQVEVEGGPPPKPVTLTIDRPFIFIIHDVVDGQILFIGRVLNPLE